MLAPFWASRQVKNNKTTGWFHSHDWVIRLNPDVLFRELDSWILPTLHNASVDAIVAKYYPGALHTDFFAFRPRVMDHDSLVVKYHKQQRRNDFHAETHIYTGFAKLLQQQRVAFLPNVTLDGGAARVGGLHCPVVHDQDVVSSCPNYLDN